MTRQGASRVALSMPSGLSHGRNLSEMGRKTKLQKQLEESIRLARKGMLPQQLHSRDALGRKLKDLDADMPTSLDDPDEIHRDG